MSVLKRFAGGLLSRVRASGTAAKTIAPLNRTTPVVSSSPAIIPESNGRNDRPDGKVLVQVQLTTELYGNYTCIARSVSPTALFLETCDLLPLGAEVHVHFGEGMVITGVVNSHYYLNYVDREGPNARAGMGVRITKTEVVQNQERRTDAPQ